MAYYSPNDDISYKSLTRKREAVLFAIFYKGGKRALQARDLIIRCHLLLVAKLSIQCAKRGLDDDLAISAGNMGMMQALTSKKFDPARGTRFATYVRTYIRGQVFSAMRANHLNFCGGNPAREGALPNIADDATVTGNPGIFQRNFPLHGNLVNNVAVATVMMNDRAAEALVDHPHEEEELAEARREAIDKACDSLNPLEAAVIRQCYLEGRTRSDVAREFGKTRQAANQAHARGLRKLYAILSPLRKELL